MEPAPVADAQTVVALLAKARNIMLGDTPKLGPPGAFRDMARVVARIRTAVERKERIAIFGDYDCDGITAVAELLRYFWRHGVKPLVRLPHRVRDGYGLTMAIVDEMKRRKIQLLITCDTGITAVAEIAALAGDGTDVIITDHHHLSEEIPDAFGILHPGLCAIPPPHPSGAGVVFKLLFALENGEHWEDMETDCALAMMGTVADLVELRGENRAIVQLGLQALQGIDRGPLMELRERTRMTGRGLKSSDIAFRIAPRINAAGRMSEPDIALRALLEGGASLDALETLNDERQEKTGLLLEQIVKDVKGAVLTPFIVRASGDYPHGLLGLLAGKLTETFGRPSLVAAIDGDTCTASLRSPPCYNIIEGLGRSAKLFRRFGGHAQAAGCTFERASLPAIEAALSDDVRSILSEDDLVPMIMIDAELKAKDITAGLCNELSLLEPFGQGNPEPKFLLRNVTIEAARAVGTDGRHLQGNIVGVACIGFNLAQFAAQCSNIDTVAHIGLNAWNGRVVPQIVIEDARVTINN